MFGHFTILCIKGLKSNIDGPYPLIEYLINLAVSKTHKKDILMKLITNVLVLLLRRQTNVWTWATEQILFRDRLQILLLWNLSTLINP